MAWIGTALFLLFITPVRAGIWVEWDGNRLRGAVGVTVWGIRGQAALTGRRGDGGRLRIMAALGGRSVSLPSPHGKSGGAKKLLGLLRHRDAWTPLRRAVQVTRLEAAVRLGGGDAAALALLTGLLRAVGGLLPGLRLRCVPVLGGKSGLRAVCIAEARLGILCTAWLMAKRKAAGGGRRAGQAPALPTRG